MKVKIVLGPPRSCMFVAHHASHDPAIARLLGVCNRIAPHCGTAATGRVVRLMLGVGAVIVSACGSESVGIDVPEPATERVFVGAADIATCTSTRDEETAVLVDSLLDVHRNAMVFAAGDNIAVDGTAQEYTDCYEPSWGRFKDRTWAVLGNREYNTGTADAAFDYFGAAIGPRDLGYYSFDLGNWHIVMLNSNTSFVPGAAGSAQDQWLRTDLATTMKSCVLAVFHHPRFFSCQDTSQNCDFKSSRVKPFWNALYAHGADVVVSGHRHHYERFGLQDPDGNLDPSSGMRQFVVGTGGTGVGVPDVIAPNSEIVNTSPAAGVIKLTLYASSYDWEFLSIPGKDLTDSGSATCHGPT